MRKRPTERVDDCVSTGARGGKRVRGQGALEDSLRTQFRPCRLHCEPTRAGFEGGEPGGEDNSEAWAAHHGAAQQAAQRKGEASRNMIYILVLTDLHIPACHIHSVHLLHLLHSVHSLSAEARSKPSTSCVSGWKSWDSCALAASPPPPPRRSMITTQSCPWAVQGKYVQSVQVSASQ